MQILIIQSNKVSQTLISSVMEISIRFNIFTIFCLLLVANFAHGTKDIFTCTTSKDQSVCLPQIYSKYDLPDPNDTNEIRMEFLIQEVLEINDKGHYITFSCYFNTGWADKRIVVDPKYAKLSWFDAQANPEIRKYLWIPKIQIYNLKEYQKKKVLNKLEGLWIGNYSSVWDTYVQLSENVHISFYCPFDFSKFPFDTQKCKFQVESYSYDTSRMVVYTSSAKFDGKTTNSFDLGYDIKINRLSREDSLLVYDGLGNFSLAGFEMTLKRRVSSYIVGYYMPSGIIIVLSWMSFLMPINHGIARMSRMIFLILLLFFLLIISIIVTINAPKGKQLTKIEEWVLGCVIFICGLILESIVLICKIDGSNKYQDIGEWQGQAYNNRKLTKEAQWIFYDNAPGKRSGVNYTSIDKYCMLSFFASFVIFTTIYWIVILLDWPWNEFGIRVPEDEGCSEYWQKNDYC